MQIYPKGKDSFPVANVSYSVYCTNDSTSVPIAQGDERIVLWEVSPVERRIPKLELLEHLRKEGPAFLRKLIDVDLSNLAGRHTLPVLMTAEKIEAMAVSRIDAASLDGVRLKLAQAIVDAAKDLHLNLKPWQGTAEDLTKFLGNWDGEEETKTLKSRSTKLGCLVMQTTDYLAENGVTLQREEGRVRQYVLSKAP